MAEDLDDRRRETDNWYLDRANDDDYRVASCLQLASVIVEGSGERQEQCDQEVGTSRAAAG